MAELALKIAVVNDYHIRMVQAASIRTFPVPVESDFYKIASQASLDYSQKTKGNSGHGLGPPDGWTFAGLIYAVNQVASKEDNQIISAWLASHSPGSKAIQQSVRLCRCENISKYLETANIHEHTGPRPQGWLAKEAQRLLDQ